MLLVLLTIAAGGVPILENPNSTLINFHPRFQEIVRLLQQKGISALTLSSRTIKRVCGMIELPTLFHEGLSM